MLDHQRELAVLGAVKARLRHREATVVPYRKAQMKIDGEMTGGGRLQVGCRWPGSFFSPTTFVVEDGAECRVSGFFDIYGGASVVVASGGVLEIAGGGGLNNGVTLSCFERVTIGKDAHIGPEVMIRDSDSHSTGTSSKGPTAPIVIGDKVWIGARAMILKGVTIGEGSVVAAGSIVTRDVPPNTLVAGAPAKPIREVSWA